MTQQQIEPKNSGTDAKQEGSGGVNFLRRNNRGCKSKDFYDWPEQSFEDMDSPLAVQQYIQQVIRKDPANIDEILKLPEGQELGAWKIEHLRLFCMQLNRLATKLQDCCQPETCNQMTATEQWIFLCAAHKQPNECPAIDYTRHTLDGAASLLNSNKYFPSRVTIKESSVAKLGSVCRRIYRIFSHAYYHHFNVFDEFERETHLCKRFSKFVTIYQLMSKDSLIVPSDGSKPEPITIDSGSSQHSTTAGNITIAAASSPTTSSETSTSDSALSSSKSDSDASCNPTLTQAKNDATRNSSNNDSNNSSKKPSTNLNEEDKANPSTVDWTASQSSTNTMLKGTTTSSLKGNPEDKAKTIPDNDSNITTKSTVTPANSNILTPKNGVESEA